MMGMEAGFVFFWSHESDGAEPTGVGRECLSQWYPAPFVVEGVRYATAEHYMMAAKARLFGDLETAAAIVDARHPAAAKKHGRAVRGFDEARWTEERYGIVVAGNRAKFRQHEALRAYLVGTGDRVLVEASPTDRIWGIGLAADHPDAVVPARWPGLNLLGAALMQVRGELASPTER